MLEVLSFSLLANLSFSFGSFYFAIFSRQVSVIWMNAFKASVCLLALTLLLIATQHSFIASPREMLYLCGSGFVGLCIGDLFMLEGMKNIGGSRIVMMFGLTPFYTGIASYFLFQSTLPLRVIYGVIAMVLCLFLLSLEKYKSSGHWHLKGILMGVMAVFLDNMGLMLTKASFNLNPSLHTLEANFYRACGAIFGFILIHFFYRRIPIKQEFVKLNNRDRSLVFMASFFGSFLSLLFYLKSVSLGHLSVVSSMAGTGPLFTEIFESLRRKKAPHPLWWMAFACFLLAIYLFTFS